MICRAFFGTIALFLLLAAGPVQAQQYRWVDKDGSTKYTDTPPPAWAKDVRKQSLAPGKPTEAQTPFEILRLQQDFPVSLYTSPNCKEGCEMARDALNKRGVPFKEVQVWNPETNEELKKVSGAVEVPTLVVGRTSHRGFEQGAFDALLDSAGYPRTGLLPARAQAAPTPPEGYIDETVKPVAVPVAAPEPQPKPGRYDPSGLQGAPRKPGQYSVPGETQ
jgi:glutaredoxin